MPNLPKLQKISPTSILISKTKDFITDLLLEAKGIEGGILPFAYAFEEIFYLTKKFADFQHFQMKNSPDHHIKGVFRNVHLVSILEKNDTKLVIYKKNKNKRVLLN